MKEKVFNPDLAVASVDTFSGVYPEINSWIMNHANWQESRDGKVKEILNFKTHITNPYRRCVGGYNRNINIFFLLAEAMWIFTGRKDVKFLTMFNKGMVDFSDDGKVFHAPYGFRLRHWGVRSEDKFCEENIHAAQGYDQVEDAIRLLSNNPNTRQVVMTIWNPDLDLGCKTKDIPCNDMVMLKIRDGKLITTIQNRSNDLHWGLPTNLFQFSFLTECIAACLGIKLGTQTHNSQSLHVYEWNKVAFTMDEEFSSDSPKNELYENYKAQERQMDFNFSHEVSGNRLRELDYHINILIENLMQIGRGQLENPEQIAEIEHFSYYLFNVYHLLRTYLQYKRNIAVEGVDKKEEAKKMYEYLLNNDQEEGNYSWDIAILARNFFAHRFDNDFTQIGKF